MILRHKFEILKLFLAVLFMVAASDVSAAPSDRLWRYLTDGSIQSSPAIGADGVIYAGSCDNFLYAVNPDGTLRWRYETDDRIYSSPSISAEDGTIYFGAWDNYLYALNNDGTLRWRYPAEDKIYSSPALGSDGVVYMTSYDKHLYAIDADGIFKWRYLTDGWIASSPVIGADGTIYVGTSTGRLYAINPDGTLLWNYMTGSYIISTPAVGADGVIYVGNLNALNAVNSNGTRRWTYPTDGWIFSSPAIGTDGIIYVGSCDGYLYAINPGGNLRWRFKTDSAIWASPALSADGTVYVGSWDGSVYAVYSAGILKWKYETENEVWSSPAIGTEGTIYVGSHDRSLHAIEGDSPRTEGDYADAMALYADSPWPRFGQNNWNLHRNLKEGETPEPDPEPVPPSLELESGVEAIPDETVSVGLILKNNEEKTVVENIDVEITYDKEKLNPLEATLTNGALDGGDYEISYQNDDETIAVTINMGTDYLFKGNGVLAYLDFVALGDVGDTTDLTFAKAVFNTEYDLLGEPDDPADDLANNGSVTFVNTQVPVPPSLELPSDVQQAFSGGTLSIPLTLVNTGTIPTPVEGVDVEIGFDNEVLNAAGAMLTGGIFENENYGIVSQSKEGSLEVTIYAKDELLTGSGLIAYLEFDVVGNIDDTTDLTFIEARANKIDVSATSTSARVVKNVFEISGNIVYYSDPTLTPVRNVQMTIEGDGTYSVATDETGSYLFSDIPPGNYVSTPSKNDDLGGLTATDVSRIERYASGLFLGFDDYQMIAADVTRNGEVDATDASRLSRYIEGEIDSLNSEGIEWVFIPVDSDNVPLNTYASDREYSPLNSNRENENFIAIRLGDVTGEWTPTEEPIRKRTLQEKRSGPWSVVPWSVVRGQRSVVSGP
ncbi:PQQ-binding-like beta-propeller repeat protein [Desulfobacterales bacterium HSG2]|nr:PQQ-binding-like beta-propeller repeat protein [Desulfobacterales bacterium HSG2]